MTVERDETLEILREMRDLQREHLAEYRRVAAASLDIQARSVEKQAQTALLYRRVVLVAGALGAPLVLLLVFLLARWGHRLF
jgi:hypothetical protein